MPGDAWAFSKQIDELGGEWGYGLFVTRALNFHTALVLPVEFYEPTQDFERAALDAHLIGKARNDQLQEEEIGNLNVVYEVFPSVFDPIDGRIPLPDQTERSIGRHSARVLDGADEGLLIAYGWSGWTPTNTALLTREYCERYLRGGLLSRRWDRGPLAHTARDLFASDDPAEFRALWRTPGNRGFEFRNLPNDRVKLLWFETWGLQTEEPADVLVLEVGRHIRAGVAIVIHGSPTSSITDLFVWPPYRRKGYGTILEGLAAERARERGNHDLEIYLWEPDAIRGNYRARAFITRNGYEVVDSSDTEFVARGIRILT